VSTKDGGRGVKEKKKYRAGGKRDAKRINNCFDSRPRNEKLGIKDPGQQETGPFK